MIPSLKPAVSSEMLPNPNIRSLWLYPFLMLFSYIPPLAYMVRATLNSRSIAPPSIGDLTISLYDFLLFFTALTTILVLAKPIRRHAQLVLATLFYICVFDWFSWQVQHKPFFIADIYRAIQLTIYYPEFFNQLALQLKLKLSVFLLLPIFLTLFIKQPAIVRVTIRHQRILKLVTYGMLSTCIVLAPWFLTVSFLKNNPFSSFITEQLREYHLKTIKTDPKIMQALFGNSTKETTSSSKAQPSKENIIFFIIETTPYAQYPDLKNLIKKHISNKWLQENSIIFHSHFSTYPASDRANYSIISGLYPPMFLDNDWKSEMNYPQSLPNVLNKQGYITYLLSTAPLSFYNDDIMNRKLGFNKIHDVEKTKTLRQKTETGYIWNRAGVYEMDEILISDTIEILKKHQSEMPDTPFMASITPQASHAPFNCPPDIGLLGYGCESDPKKIEANAVWQFKLLDRLIGALDEMHLLDNLILVVTGDHGIRSRQESTLFENANLMQDITFHVPFAIASSNIQATQHDFNHPTSHIDIAPTIVDALGLQQPSPQFHGRSVFDESPRTLFFIGSGYLPVDGFLKDSMFYMENRTIDLYLSSKNMEFRNQPKKRAAIKPKPEEVIKANLPVLEAFLRKEYYPDK